MEGFGSVFGFYAMAALTLLSAGGVILSRNLPHAVLFLILTFIGVAGFYILLSAEFIALAQIIIYVGAISVLVLFAVLLTPRAGRDNGETKMALPGIFLAVCLAAVLAFVINDTNWATVATSPELTASSLGEALLDAWA